MKNYKKATEIKIPSQNLELDPRSQTSIRGRNYIATGDTTEVKGTKRMRADKKPVKATWY